jgi:hypothetical protein
MSTRTKSAKPARHRWHRHTPWESTCTKCKLHRKTEYDMDAIYQMPDGRRWRRWAPPCPPPEAAKTADDLKATEVAT